MARHAGYDRDEALAKAQALFWHKGYHATSLKDLEAALGMHPGSIYAAFTSKEALFAETLHLYGQQSREQLGRIRGSVASPLAALAAYVRALGRADPDALPSRACMLVKTLLETPGEDTALHRQTEEMMREMEAEFAAIYHAARGAGELPDTADPERMASRLQAEIFGLRAYAQRGDVQEKVRDLAEDIARDIEMSGKR